MVRSEKSKERHRRKQALDAEAASASEWDMLEEEEDGGGKKFQPFVREMCWSKAEEVKGRDPNRWRRDALGNILFRKLDNCPGCLCHNYLPIIPFSKG